MAKWDELDPEARREAAMAWLVKWMTVWHAVSGAKGIILGSLGWLSAAVFTRSDIASRILAAITGG